MRHLRRTALALATAIGLALVVLAACEDADSSGSAPSPQSSPAAPVDGAPTAFDTVDEGFNSGVRGEQPQVLKLETEAEWADFWSRHMANVIPLPDPPTVDFSWEMVLAVVDQQRPSGGFQLEITEVEETEGSLVVRVSRRVPGPDCIVTAVITQPFHIVSVDRSGLEPELAIREETYSCEGP